MFSMLKRMQNIYQEISTLAATAYFLLKQELNRRGTIDLETIYH